jgi:hypothetical protein
MASHRQELLLALERHSYRSSASIGNYFFAVYRLHAGDPMGFAREVEEAWREVARSEIPYGKRRSLKRTWDQYKSDCKIAIEQDLEAWCNRRSHRVESMSGLKRHLQSMRKDDGREVATISIFGMVCELVGKAEAFSPDTRASARTILWETVASLKELVGKVDD